MKLVTVVLTKMFRRDFINILATTSISGLSASPDAVSDSANKPEERTDQGWWKFGGDLRNTSYYAGELGFDDPDVGWSYETCGQVLSSPSVVDGSVYFGSDDGYLYGLESSTGTARWRTQLDGPIDCSPAIHENTVYVGTRGNSFYALDAGSGEKVWRFKTGWWVRSSPVVCEDLVCFGCFDGYLYALDPETGNEVWKYPVGEKVYTSPAVAGEVLYVGDFDGVFHSVDISDGQPIWRNEMNSTIGSSPLVTDDAVYVAERDGVLHRLDRRTGENIWSYDGEGNTGSSPAYDGDHIYICIGADILAVDTYSGGEVWSYGTSEPIYASNPLATQSAVYTGADDGLVRALSPESGELLWSYEVGDTVRSLPAPSDGYLYFGSYDGALYALGETDREEVIGRDCVEEDQVRNAEPDDLFRDRGELQENSSGVKAGKTVEGGYRSSDRGLVRWIIDILFRW